MKDFTKQNAKDLPQSPGVYIYYNKLRKPIYIGKSKSLRDRVSSYFIRGLNEKTKQMLEEAKYFRTINVGSELEALLLEARLVKKHKPIYNISLKDDKQPLYIKITKEKYPRVITARKRSKKEKSQLFVGPFPSSSNVKKVLSILRKMFGYSNHKPGKRACLYSQMGLCNPCPSAVENTKDKNKKKVLQAKYKKNIEIIKKTLKGRFLQVRKELRHQMESMAKVRNYEEAAKYRDKLRLFEYITQPITPAVDFLKNPNLIQDIRKEELDEFKKLLNPYFINITEIKRIECYDVAHLSGVNATASMVTFINGEPEKKLYRHFKINQIKRKSDTDSLQEVAERRIRHIKDWGKPDLIIVDGGKGQVSVFHRVLKVCQIPVVGIAKRTESLVVPKLHNKGSTKSRYKQFKLNKGPVLYLVQRIRDEAHRFARRYHHKLVKSALIPS